MNDKLANDLIRYAELVEDGALISPEEMNCASVMRLAAEYLAQPEQEPVAHFGSAYVNENGVHITTVLGLVAIPQDAKLYTTPPQRKPLTDEEIGAILEGVNAYGTRLYTFARAIEAKLKEKNNGSW